MKDKIEGSIDIDSCTELKKATSCFGHYKVDDYDLKDKSSFLDGNKNF